MKVTGAVWKFPQDDINTDQIRRKNYAYLPAKEQASHCMEGLAPEFAASMSPGERSLISKPGSLLRPAKMIDHRFCTALLGNARGIHAYLVNARARGDVERFMVRVTELDIGDEFRSQDRAQVFAFRRYDPHA